MVIKRLFSILERRNVFFILILLNVIVGLIIFSISSSVDFPDSAGYWNMAKGISKGNFSSWYFLPVYTPETLRTWGYPFFVYLCQLVSDSQLAVKIVQLVLHIITIALLLKLIRHFNPRVLIQNIFLAVLLLNIQIVYYAGQIASESVTIFFLVLFIYTWYCKRTTWLKYIALGVIGAIVFQLRPAFLIFPIVLFVYSLFFNRKELRYQTAFIFVFGLLLLPFGFWNKYNHGVFKITPIEGGAGAANLGFWSFRLPDGYNPKFYWDATFSSDFTQPEFFSNDEKLKFKELYEQQWLKINDELVPFFTSEDTIRKEYFKNTNTNLFVIMSGRYTQAREKILKKYLIYDIKKNPAYYLKTRLYTLFRMWFTGVNKAEFKKSSFFGKAKVLYSFVVTFIFILSGLMFVLFAFKKKWLSWSVYWPVILLILYFGIVHLPFVIQARYTVPVHIFILMLLSLAIGRLVTKNVNGLQAKQL